jgi:hypothetical protein
MRNNNQLLQRSEDGRIIVDLGVLIEKIKFDAELSNEENTFIQSLELQEKNHLAGGQDGSIN